MDTNKWEEIFTIEGFNEGSINNELIIFRVGK